VRGDIFFVTLLAPRGPLGHEQIGTRPALVVQADMSGFALPTTMIVPMTSQLSALRYPHTIRVDPSPDNGLSVPSVLLTFQLRALDTSRLSRRVGHLEAHYMDQLETELRHLLALS
jgi:mRNA interferase MazF